MNVGWGKYSLGGKDPEFTVDIIHEMPIRCPVGGGVNR